MGRKKEIVTRTEYISFRVSALEKKVIELSAKEANLSTSNFTRRAAMNMKVTLRFSPEELKAYNDLHKYHVNFTYISNLIKSSDVNKKEKLIKEIEVVQTLIKQHIIKFEK